MSDLTNKQSAINALERILNCCEEIDLHIPKNERTGYSMFRDYKVIKNYLYAQTEIIRCGECKYWRADHTCKEHSLVSPMLAYDFCSRAERRTNGGTD